MQLFDSHMVSISSSTSSSLSWTSSFTGIAYLLLTDLLAVTVPSDANYTIGEDTTSVHNVNGDSVACCEERRADCDSAGSTVLPNCAVMEVHSWLFDNETSLQFGNIPIELPKDSFKFSVLLSNWRFSSFGNFL